VQVVLLPDKTSQDSLPC